MRLSDCQTHGKQSFTNKSDVFIVLPLDSMAFRLRFEFFSGGS